MSYLLSNVKQCNGEICSVYLDNERISQIFPFVVDSVETLEKDHNIILDPAHFIQLDGCSILPGFIDVHVHLREPGFFYKETIETGTQAAAHGGYTHICSMPNLDPTPDSAEHLQVQLDLIKEHACINVYPYGTITVGELGKELANFEELLPNVCGFSDDGRGVQDEDMMRKAMQKAKELDTIIVAHCEDNTLLHNGYIHDGEYAKQNNHRGISSESEWKQIERDLKLAEETGCKYHVCHISTKESVSLIREAKKRGVDVTCETAPHYLLLSDEELREDGCFKMNPPLRSAEDREALIEGMMDGTIDMIATDHAPHTQEEKSRGLEKSAFGIVGLEIAFPILYTNFVMHDIIPLEKLIDLLHTNPKNRFGIGTDFKVGEKANFTIFHLENTYKIDTKEFFSMGKSTPFANEFVSGECVVTVCNGKIAYSFHTMD